MRISDWSSDVCSSDLSSASTSSSERACSASAAASTAEVPSVSRAANVARASPCAVAASSTAALSSSSREPSDSSCAATWRSEEHTSELQSLMRISYAVFCLKKKKINKNITSHIKDNEKT